MSDQISRLRAITRAFDLEALHPELGRIFDEIMPDPHVYGEELAARVRSALRESLSPEDEMDEFRRPGLDCQP